MAQFEVRRLALVTLPSSHLRLVIYVPFARFDVCSASITTSRWYQPYLQLITPTTIKKRKFISEIRSMKLLPACTLRLCKSDFNLIFRLIVMKRVWKYENIWKAFRERVCDCLPFLWLVKIRSFLVTLSPAIVCWQKREERKKKFCTRTNLAFIDYESCTATVAPSRFRDDEWLSIKIKFTLCVKSERKKKAKLKSIETTLKNVLT